MKIGLVGRTNVGKSTLFNKLIGSHRAIVTDISGTTRDIISECFEIDGNKFVLYDSPGLDKFEDELKLIEDIVRESDVLLFVVDGKQGIHPKDEKIFQLISKYGKKNNTILIVNKLDGKVYTDNVYQYLSDFYKFGIENILPLSARQNEGLEKLLDKILYLKGQYNLPDENCEKDNILPLAIVGRPNVGKSTLLNKLAGEEFAKVSDIAGTTLDYISCEINYKGKKIRLFDTAGVRKKGKIHGLEKIAFNKTFKMLEYVKPVVVLLIDATQGLVHRDLTLLGDILKFKLPIVFAINKIDELSSEDEKKLLKLVTNKLSFAKWIPIVSISAKEGIGLPKLLDWVGISYKNYFKRISTSKLNKVLRDRWLLSPPRFPKNKICKFYYSTQTHVSPPTFKLFVNNIDFVNFSFKKWLENTIRTNFDFVGSPIVFDFENRK